MRPLSIPDQVVAAIRTGIMEARWLHELPSEAVLCRDLQVSRSSLRRALGRLAQDGWLSSEGHGRHHRIHQQSLNRKEAPKKVVRFLSPFPTHGLGSVQSAMLVTIAERLGSINCRVEYEHHPALFDRHLPRQLERLTRLPDTVAWVLYYSTPSMQRWFADHHLPCVVVGRCAENVELPCVFPAADAVGSHAANLFCQRGHRLMVYASVHRTSLSDRLCAETFAKKAQQLGARVHTIIHHPESSELTDALSRLLAVRPRPTAFFSTEPKSCLTILCYLRENGWRVPADASIISGWDDDFLHCCIPRFACYQVDGKRMGRRAATLLLHLIRRGDRQPRAIPLMPEFLVNQTLSAPL